MRTETVSAGGFTVVVRGRTRRTLALEQEYLVNLKQNHPEMKELVVDKASSADELMKLYPHSLSLSGVASNFRDLMSRVSEFSGPDLDLFEPFAPAVLVTLFNMYLDSEDTDDDLWSKIRTAIEHLDKPEPITDPNSDGSLKAKLPI